MSENHQACEECYPDPPLAWYEQPLNEYIRARRTVQPPKQFYPSFMAAAEAWGPHITEGLTNAPQG